jgi:hypothetical protein
VIVFDELTLLITHVFGNHALATEADPLAQSGPSCENIRKTWMGWEFGKTIVFSNRMLIGQAL